MGVSVNQDGSYAGTWVPLKAGKYQLQLRLDGKEAGTKKELAVTPPPLVKEKEDEAEPPPEAGEKKAEFEVVTIKVSLGVMTQDWSESWGVEHREAVRRKLPLFSTGGVLHLYLSSHHFI